MKLKKIIKYILIILSLVAVLFITKILISFISEKNDIPNNYIIENNTNQINDLKEEINTETQAKFDENTIGVLKIPKIDLEAEIKEGVELDVLAQYIGHFRNSSLWDGNVALASHNRGNSVAHHFERIHLLENGDEILYITNLGERRYTVYNTKEIDSIDWSVTLETSENIINLITCISNKPEKRLCVQAKAI